MAQGKASSGSAGGDQGGSVYLAPPANVVAAAKVKDVDALLGKAMADPDAFWAAHAETLEWADKWHTVLETDHPHHRWFSGGTTNITVNCLDRHVMDGFGEKRALTFVAESGEIRQYTYAEVLAEVSRVANALYGLGVRKGDRVVIYMPLMPEGIFTMLACARMGAIHSVVYAGMGETALRTRIEDSGAKALVYADATYRRGQEVDLLKIVMGGLAGLAKRPEVIIGLNRRKGKGLPEGHLGFIETVAAAEEAFDPEVLDAEHPLFILYTSGTTGRPKGVLHVHGGYMVGLDYCARNYFEIDRGSVWWSLSDIGWIVGHSYICYGPFLAGGEQIIREGAPDFPDPTVVWKLVERFKVTQMFVSPTLIRMYMRMGKGALEGSDRSSLRLMACAGEPLNPEAAAWATENILSANGRAHGYIMDNFWQTEVASPLLATFPVMPGRPGYAGRAMPTVRTRIVDAEGHPVGPDKPGSLIIERPMPYMMRTIWNDDERYRSVWSKTLGGYVTGDLATMDENGYIAILGRSDDVINIAGHRIGTAEIESCLIEHPSVAEAAAIGLPDEVKGARIKVFVILKKGFTASDELAHELVAHVRKNLGPIAQPSEIQFMDKLPKTRSGKIMRRLLKARELGQDLGDTSTLEE